MPPDFQQSEPPEICNYPARQTQSSRVELVALEGGLTRSSRAFDAQCARAARLLSACGDDAQAAGVLRMLAQARRSAAPKGNASRAAAGRPRNPGPPPPIPPGPGAGRSGRGRPLVALLAVGIAVWTLAAILGLFLLLAWAAG